MYRKSRQAHTRHTLKHSPLRHDAPIIFEGRYTAPLEAGRARARMVVSGVRGADGAHARLAGMEDLLVAQVGFVAFVADVTEEVGPGDAVGAADQPWVGDGAEGFADVGGVGYVAVGAEEDGAGAS